MSDHRDDAGAELDWELVEYEKPFLTVTDFQHVARPLLDEGTGELVGIELWLHHPAWPAGACLKLARLYAVELATGILALIESHDKPDDGPTATERG